SRSRRCARRGASSGSRPSSCTSSPPPAARPSSSSASRQRRLPKSPSSPRVDPMRTTGARLQSLLGRVRGGRAPAGRRDPAPCDWRKTVRARLLVCAGGLGLWTAGIEARLVYLQVADHGELMERADRQQNRTYVLPAKRGEVFDRKGRVM